ncbi:hypothetical protein RHGRI_029523 [Rhododendron griersonianum]|uniref:Pre-mRNA-splicing factor SYF2 n=1 Tax=Rhododendron griersonianum TaxID=479676 RepID=A0AAV6IND8_9ERIC|nr:hypothetical protein RHGRI_029523 [Rhododendron griersonianum]
MILAMGCINNNVNGKIEKMVKEFKERDEKRKSFSWRRRFHDEKDIDSINVRHEHFNKTNMVSTYSEGQVG